MDKQDMIKILVVVVAFGFLTEILAFKGTVPFIGGDIISSAANITGTTTFNGSIRTYDPFLLVPANTSKALMDQIGTRDGVKSVQLQAEGYVVQTDTRDDVYPLAVYLRSQNVSSVSVANIVSRRASSYPRLQAMSTLPRPGSSGWRQSRSSMSTTWSPSR